MNEEKNIEVNKRTLATRDIGLESIIVTGVFAALMVAGACTIEDKRFIFIPLLFLAVSSVVLGFFVFRYVTEPKIAIQADAEGIYFYYRNHKEVYIKLDEVTGASAYGVWGKWGGIRITTQTAEYKSIDIKEDKYALAGNIRFLLTTKDKEHYLSVIELKTK